MAKYECFLVDCEPECRMLPTPREFCRHILSERSTQAASNKRRLHPVSGGISLLQPVTYVTITYSEKNK